MGDFYTNKNKSISIQEIVLKHIQKILEISTREFKANCKREIYSGNQVSVIIEEDARIIYCQSVENLSYVLIPYFDAKMEEGYEEMIEVLNLPLYVYSKKFEKEIKKLIKDTTGQETEPNPNQVEKIQITHMLQVAKTLFRNLNLLLKRKRYLKAGTYIEGSEEENEIVDTDEESK